MIWRIVSSKIATLTEIKENWDLEELLDAHEVLDIQDIMELNNYDS